MSKTWEELQLIKDNAMLDGDIDRAMFWQNEVIIYQLKTITWSLKQIAEKGNNV